MLFKFSADRQHTTFCLFKTTRSVYETSIQHPSGPSKYLLDILSVITKRLFKVSGIASKKLSICCRKSVVITAWNFLRKITSC